MADKLKIIKKSALDWFFIVNEIDSTLRTISDFECNIGDTFNIVEIDGSRIFIKNLSDITLIDETTAKIYQNTIDPVVLTDRLRNLDFVPFRGQSTSTPSVSFTETNLTFIGSYSFTLGLNLSIRQVLIGASYDVPKVDYTYNPSTGALAIIGDSADLGVENGTLIRVRSF